MQHQESKIQHEIVMALQGAGVYCHSVPNEGAGESRNRTMQLMAIGMKPGVADLVLWVPVGKKTAIAYLEIKTPSGRLSDAQRRFMARCADSGIPYGVARSVDDAMAFVRALQEQG